MLNHTLRRGVPKRIRKRVRLPAAMSAQHSANAMAVPRLAEISLMFTSPTPAVPSPSMSTLPNSSAISTQPVSLPSQALW